MRKVLKFLRVLQIKKSRNALGYTYEKIRLNPYNPLSYLLILLTFFIGILLFGFVGVWSEIDFRDAKFKYR